MRQDFSQSLQRVFKLINNSPVNALSQAVRAGLSDCLKEALNDSAAEAVIVTGGGRTLWLEQIFQNLESLL